MNFYTRKLLFKLFPRDIVGEIEKHLLPRRFRSISLISNDLDNINTRKQTYTSQNNPGLYYYASLITMKRGSGGYWGSVRRYLM